MLTGLGILAVFWVDLPHGVEELNDFTPQELTRIYAADGEIIGEFYLQRREVVPYNKIPPHVVNAFIAAEDNRYFTHQGIDPMGIMRAAIKNLRAGRIVEGGSTITQQLARALLLSPERTASRKIKEALLAFKIERTLSKEQILHLYLNYIYLGHGAYGVQAASAVYFGKDVSALGIHEAALLAGLPKAPSIINPYVDFPRSKERQKYVLGRMVTCEFISSDEEQLYSEMPINLVSSEELGQQVAPDYVEYVRRYLRREYGHSALYRGGLRVETSLDPTIQRYALDAVRRGLEKVDLRQGFRGPVAHLESDEEIRTFTSSPPAQANLPIAGLRTYCAEDICAGGIYQAVVADVKKKKPSIMVGSARAVELEQESLAAISRKWAENTSPAQATDDAPKGISDDGPLSNNSSSSDSSYAQTQANAQPRPAPQLHPHTAGQAPKPRHKTSSPTRQKDELAKGDIINIRVIELKDSGTIKAEIFQLPHIEGAMVAMEPNTGLVRAMVGGYSFSQSEFNRAVQAKRQSGSVIKPLIYSAALSRGYTQLSIINDSPVAYRTESGTWRPRNFGGRYHGPVTLRTALAKSLNSVAVKILAHIGVESALDRLRALGIQSSLPANLSLALGSGSVSPLELTTAYAVFPSGGVAVKPVFITRVVDGEGNVLEENNLHAAQQVVSSEHAYVMADMMSAVVKEGTARQALSLNLPLAGKTGTTNDFRDAWFVGFSPQLVAGVWVGNDDFTPIGDGETGGRAALPIWTDFMEHAHSMIQVASFNVPGGVVFVRANGHTGAPSKPGDSSSLLIPFEKGTIPDSFLKSLGMNTGNKGLDGLYF